MNRLDKDSYKVTRLPLDFGHKPAEITTLRSLNAEYPCTICIDTGPARTMLATTPEAVRELIENLQQLVDSVETGEAA